MSKKKNNAPKTDAQQETGKSHISPDRKELKQLLLKLVEENTQENRFSDKHFDRESKKHALLSNAEISIKQVKDYIRGIARPYKPMFRITFWRQMYRILGWPQGEAEVYFKRRAAAMFIREVIYGCFDAGVLMSLHVLNPYTGYIKREYKHFQFMTDEGIERLSTIIEDAIDIMKGCETHIEFRKKWHKKYGVPYQKDAFDK